MLVYFSKFDFSEIFEPLIPFLNGFNNFFYVLFKKANYLFFFLFLIMSILLLINAREREYDEKVHGKEELVKKRGRIGMVIYFILAFAFLSEDLLKSLFQLFKILPEPAILLGYMEDFDSISLNDVHSLNIGLRTLFFFINFLSLISLFLIIIGIYLMFFNKFILRSKLKFMAFIGVGFFFWVLVGFRTSLSLMI